MIPSYLSDSTDPFLWARSLIQVHPFPPSEEVMVEWFRAALKAGDVAGYAAGYNEGFENGQHE